MKSKGLGDSIHKIITATGIKTLTELATSALKVDDCGCDKRKEWLNNQFPYKT